MILVWNRYTDKNLPKLYMIVEISAIRENM